jgi:hypothetical protein
MKGLAGDAAREMGMKLETRVSRDSFFVHKYRNGMVLGVGYEWTSIFGRAIKSMIFFLIH